MQGMLQHKVIMCVCACVCRRQLVVMFQVGETGKILSVTSLPHCALSLLHHLSPLLPLHQDKLIARLQGLVDANNITASPGGSLNGSPQVCVEGGRERWLVGCSSGL